MHRRHSRHPSAVVVSLGGRTGAHAERERERETQHRMLLHPDKLVRCCLA